MVLSYEVFYYVNELGISEICIWQEKTYQKSKYDEIYAG